MDSSNKQTNCGTDSPPSPIHSQFCWICMGSWADHGANTGGYYKCNRYDPAKPTKEEEDGAKAKAELDRCVACAVVCLGGW